MSIQQMLLGVGAVATKTYVDDCFSTYLYKGTGETRAINNGINVSEEGALVWVKSRTAGQDNWLFDTVRGSGYGLRSNNSYDQTSTGSGYCTSFNNNGFSLGYQGSVNSSSHTFSSWTFRKAPGFFDVFTYSNAGADNTKTVNHNLGCSPGLIIIKSIDTAGEPWTIYHKDLGVGASSTLNFSTDAAYGPANRHFTAVPNSTSFTLTANNTATNAGGTAGAKDYVAYVFAGGKASETNSVYFDGTGDYLSLAASSDLTFDGDFTIEWWSYRGASGGMSAFGIGNLQTLGGMEMFFHSADGKVHIYTTDSSGGSNRLVSTDTFAVSKWQHYALVRSGSTITLYFDGKSQGSWTENQTLGPSGNNTFTIGCSTGNSGVSALWTGKISNFRITKGQAVYSTTFNVPHDPLTQTSQNANSGNVKLLCCNGSTTTASTVTPGTITANGDPTIQGSQTIFDDTAANIYGAAGDQGVIKCGSYIGNGNADGPEINLGWEPQWLLIKSATESGENWAIFDSMRGVVSGGDDKYLYANSSGTENTYNVIELTPTGFKCDRDDGTTNRDGETFIFCAIRRPDGYVGKPPELGTGVFTTDTGNSNDYIPVFDSSFPVDFALRRKIGQADDWDATNRLTQATRLKTNSNAAKSNHTSSTYDSNVGWSNGEWDTNYQSWMWKRHAGFDVVAYRGDHIDNRQIPHSLSKSPEMIWTKNRDTTDNWVVWHKGLTGTVATGHILLNLTNASANAGAIYGGGNAVAPTSTHWSVGTHETTNDDRYDYISMLFASVNGISKVDKYEGNGNASGPTVTLGFQPRLIIIKAIETTGNWIFIKVTGTGTTNNSGAYLDDDDDFFGAAYVNVTSTGFSITDNGSEVNQDGKDYLYYAHA